jgi:hypothetical protein
MIEMKDQGNVDFRLKTVTIEEISAQLAKKEKFNLD